MQAPEAMPEASRSKSGGDMTTTQMQTLFASVVLVLCACISAPAWAVTGSATATYYSDRFEGRPTASSERFHQQGLTAAHNSLPFGTRVKVTNIENGRSVVVKVNDRMHPRKNNAIDLTKRAARELGFLRDGRTAVKLEVVK
jgi:rare lipoprotein A